MSHTLPGQKHHRLKVSRGAIILSAYSTLLFVLFSSITVTAAQTIAFFPLLDLTHDPNGINTPFSERVYQELEKLGKTLLPEKDIMSFLVRNRIRQLGKLTSYQNSLIHKELGADLTLLGTICQLDDQDAPGLSLNLQLSRTSDSRIIWAKTENIGYADMTSLLGIHDPKTLDDIYDPFFSDMFATLPNVTTSQNQSLSTLDIATVYLQPNFLKPGEEVSCKLKMHKTLDENGIQPKLFVSDRGTEHPLIQDPEGYYLTVTWTAQKQAGEHPVFLIARWPSGATRRGIIGSYGVDDHAPGAKLILIATELDGELFFSDKLKIIPKLTDPEPIVRWEISVIDEKDKVVVLMGAPHTIPRSLTWKGKTSLGNVAAPGKYLIRFKVWDRAQRESSAETTINFMPKPPEISVEFTSTEDTVNVDLACATDTPLAYWFAKFIAEDGRLLKLVQGTSLPINFDLPDKTTTDQKILCIVSARDILGNQYQQKIPDLFGKKDDANKKKETSIETEWLEDF